MEISQEILDIVEAIKQAIAVERIYLFGSYAYGTPNEDSDYDFYVVLPDDGPRVLETLMRARKALPLDRNTSVDILANPQSRFDERRQYNNSLERKVYDEGVILYEHRQELRAEVTGKQAKNGAGTAKTSAPGVIAYDAPGAIRPDKPSAAKPENRPSKKGGGKK